MEKDRRVETAEYDGGEGFMAWCSVCQIILVEDVTQGAAELVADDHVNKHKHLTFVASPTKSPYQP